MTTIIASTNRPDSYTLKVADYYLRELKKLDINTSLLSLTNLPEGLIHPDMYKSCKLDSFKATQDLISRTEKFIFIIPEYNGSFPGILKLLIDSCSFPDSFSGKKAILTGISTGKYGNIRGVDHFTGVCHYLQMHVMPLKLHIPSIHREIDESGNFVNAETLKYVNLQIKQASEF